MLTPLEKVLLAFVLLATATAFLAPLFRRYRIIRAGTPDNRFDRMAVRAAAALYKILFQRCTLKDERLFTGLMHVFIFYGALTFDTMTVDVRLEKCIRLGSTALRLMADVFNVFNQNQATEESAWTNSEFPLRFATRIQSPRLFRAGLNFEF